MNGKIDSGMASTVPFDCPICGNRVPAKAKACPSCGACDKTGWNEEATAADGLDLPDDDFDYEKFTRDEFTPRKGWQMKLVYWIAAVVLLFVTVGLSVYSMLFSQ
jgi:hypothetical protein